MQEQQRLALLDTQTHTQHTAAVICTTSSTQHPPTGGGRGKAQSARRLGGLGGPPRPASPGFPNNQQPARVTTSSARAWQCPSSRILVVLRELALAREREGRKRPFLTSTPPLVGSTPQNFRSLRRWGLLCCI
jgi:hypothetical protein